MTHFRVLGRWRTQSGMLRNDGVPETSIQAGLTPELRVGNETDGYRSKGAAISTSHE